MRRVEAYRRGDRATPETPYVTLLKRGALSLSRSAYRALGSPEFVDLLFDAPELIIGLRAAEPDADTAQRVRPTSAHGPVHVSAMAFVKYHRLDVSMSR